MISGMVGAGLAQSEVQICLRSAVQMQVTSSFLPVVFFSLLGASSSVAPFFQYDFQGAHVAICEQSLVTHYIESLTGEPRFPVPMCHLTGWISILRGGQWSLYATKGRQLCGPGAGASVEWLGVGFCQAPLGITSLAHLYHLFSGELSQTTQTVKSTLQAMAGWASGYKFLEVTLSLPSVLVKTDSLFETMFLCLSFLVLPWLKIEPIWGFSFIQSCEFEFAI